VVANKDPTCKRTFAKTLGAKRRVGPKKIENRTDVVESLSQNCVKLVPKGVTVRVPKEAQNCGRIAREYRLNEFHRVREQFNAGINVHGPSIPMKPAMRPQLDLPRTPWKVVRQNRILMDKGPAVWLQGLQVREANEVSSG
jgi:hypothetical protein